MNTRVVILAIVLFVALVAGMFVFAYLKRAELAKPVETAQPSTETVTTPYDYITRVDTKHFFENGVHTLAGDIDMPTPCDLLETSATVAESMPEHVQVNFSVLNTADMCEQKVTKQRFKVSFTASSSADISAKFMGRAIMLNLIPPAEGETPDDFELYIKG